mgnify:FL=1
MFGSMMGEVDPYGSVAGAAGTGANPMASLMQRMMPTMRSPMQGAKSPFKMPDSGLMGIMGGKAAPGGLLGMLMSGMGGMGGGAGGAPGPPMSLLPSGLPMSLPPGGFNANGLY